MVVLVVDRDEECIWGRGSLKSGGVGKWGVGLVFLSFIFPIVTLGVFFFFFSIFSPVFLFLFGFRRSWFFFFYFYFFIFFSL